MLFYKVGELFIQYLQAVIICLFFYSQMNVNIIQTLHYVTLIQLLKTNDWHLSSNHNLAIKHNLLPMHSRTYEIGFEKKQKAHFPC